MPISPKILIPHKTHTITIPISTGHSNSAYSFEVVSPIASETTATATTKIYNQNCSFPMNIKNFDSAIETFKTLCPT